jgi:hypothetical protein
MRDTDPGVSRNRDRGLSKAVEAQMCRAQVGLRLGSGSDIKRR